jgi:tRNA (cytidine56-2'-O)-methyltransferase
MKIHVLRLGHRAGRDPRISTHCGLVSRAFGANRIIYSGEKDQKLLEGIRKVSRQWGGKFGVKYEKNWRKIIKEFKGEKIHLTMYGLPVQKVIPKIRKKKSILVIVGGEKVPPEVYELADWNVSVTNQPHSEIAALSVFLDHFFKGKELGKRFPKAKKRIIPQERGKKLIEK